ncbi:MAG: hypothetical protein R2854_08880 [Caldilineaceae bacterium]
MSTTSSVGAPGARRRAPPSPWPSQPAPGIARRSQATGVMAELDECAGVLARGDVNRGRCCSARSSAICGDALHADGLADPARMWPPPA